MYSMPEKPGTFPITTQQKQSEDSTIMKENRLRCMLLNYICVFISYLFYSLAFPSFKGNAFKIHYRLSLSFMQSNKLF